MKAEHVKVWLGAAGGWFWSHYPHDAWKADRMSGDFDTRPQAVEDAVATYPCLNIVVEAESSEP